ncbi:hypothetical protein [Methanobrevibacter sp.]|uniref:hypothetical protein n=1 Tax=Methanobrevibacter sp. TaxID=66852 RepID=UPI0026E0631A|nr:hypothetical protein [Methanobrevibacter sp.]MDO5860158.1 hypothetical protein [Methanobrevibacter sp.]
MMEEILKEYYSSGVFKDSSEIFKKRCRERKCILKGNFDDYIILDGDEIEKCLSKNKNKSTDCILIDKNADKNNNVEIILCELCVGSKDYKNVRNKIINSAERIVDVFRTLGIGVGSLKCCYLGKYENYKRSIKLISKPILIHGFNRHDILIENFS